MDTHDHRVLGPKLDLFHQQDEAPGTAFWHSRGAMVYLLVEDYIRREMRRAGFHEVRTPQLMAKSLWERSGHWDKFGSNMFVFEDGDRRYALKPMNCPGHVQLFRQQIRSYRDLPIRFAEFGACHRYEPSGSLHGLLRGRAFTQDDAHVFCLAEHVDAEVADFCDLLRRVYSRFGFEEFKVGLSTRPSAREGSDTTWDKAEALLEAAAVSAGLEFRHQPGEGAFYGPKLEFVLTDCDGRDWQCGTIQLDLILPEKLGAEVIDARGDRIRPVMIHHAVLGSIERFMAVLLEHHRGQLPFWLAPDQVVVAPISADQNEYAHTIVRSLKEAGIRCIVDDSNETLSRRIVYARDKCIPIFVTVGQREVTARSVSIREFGGRQSVKPLDEATSWLKSMATMSDSH